jgi:sugar transferase (PEP-CTERM/EpsH1 system associated)
MICSPKIKKPLLFLAHRIPYPPNKGEKIRSWHFLRGLAQEYELHVGALVDDQDDLKDIQPLKEISASLCLPIIQPRTEKIKALRGLLTGQPLSLPYFYNRQLADFVKNFTKQHPNAPVFLYSSGMAGYVSHLNETMPLIVDLVDVDSAKWDEYALKEKFPLSWIYKREGALLAQTEAFLSEKAALTLLVSEAEKDLFLTRLPPPLRKRSIQSLENGVDLDYFNPDQDYPLPADMPLKKPTLVFTGAMDYAPNRDAVIWFTNEILPLIHKGGFPDCHFMIVGSKPSADVQALSGEYVTVTGRVPDVRPYLAHASLAVAPMRVARGVQNKVLEAMAMRKPTITTPQGFEGLISQAGYDLQVVSGAEDFADMIIRLLRNSDERHALGQAAYTQMSLHYAWESRQDALRRSIQQYAFCC